MLVMGGLNDFESMLLNVWVLHSAQVLARFELERAAS